MTIPLNTQKSGRISFPELAVMVVGLLLQVADAVRLGHEQQDTEGFELKAFF